MVHVASRPGVHRSRGMDFVDALQTFLGPLADFTALAHELVQNADDPDGATRLSFDVREDALVVDNDGVFTDCGEQDEDRCPWLADRPYECDFHSFRRVAGGNKRHRADTTGAFGIGFTAVYRITDHPELISNGRHWIVDDASRNEDERIYECPGCPSCRAAWLPGTRFVLPWATDPSSTLRRRLRVAAVQPEDRSALAHQILDAIPPAMVFLKRLTCIEIHRDGQLARRFERLVEGDGILITGGPRDDGWYLLRGTFEEEAGALGEHVRDLVEAKRTFAVTLAISPDTPIDGRLYAMLPTQHRSGLPFHINADFYPTPDRKHIILADPPPQGRAVVMTEEDFRSAWNRAALQGAARTLAEGVLGLRDRLSPALFWRMIQSIHDADDSLPYFWKALLPVLQAAPVIRTTNGGWCRPDRAVLLESPDEEDAVPVLEALGLHLVHRDLRTHFTLLVQRAAFGIPRLDATRLAAALRDRGYADGAPRAPVDPATMGLLWRELGRLLARVTESQRGGVHGDLRACSIAPARDGQLWPCQAVFVPDGETTIAAFEGIDPRFRFFDPLGGEATAVAQLCPAFTAEAAIGLLAQLSADELAAAYERDDLDPAAILEWFAARRVEILGTPGLRDTLVALPIFPAIGGGLRPLIHLALAGGFSDELGLTDTVDLARLDFRDDFLRNDLGIGELTFLSYIRHHAPAAFAGEDTPPPDQIRWLARTLVSHLDELRGHDDLRYALSRLPLIECDDGSFQPAQAAYFSDDVTRTILGTGVRMTPLRADADLGLCQLYHWLRVSDGPRLVHILRRIKDLTGFAPAEDSIAAMQPIIAHLGRRFMDASQIPDNLHILGMLKSQAWLPARGDRQRWYRPGEIYTGFRSYLFESIGKFLDLPIPQQQACADFLKFLEMPGEPEPAMVVSHLLACAASGKPVRGIYLYLSQYYDEHPGDTALVERLRGQPCLLLSVDGEELYVRPDTVYWNDHGFGRYRFRLPDENRQYHRLFAALGVKEHPDHADALAVLREIAADFAPRHRTLDDEAYRVVIHCWQQLSHTLQHSADAGELAAVRAAIQELRGEEIVPDARRLLLVPRHLLFDDRPELAAKFEPAARTYLIPRHDLAWPAMAEAGVRSLSAEARAIVADSEADLEERDFVAGRVRARRALIARVLAAQTAASEALSILDDLRFLALRRLQVYYMLTIYTRAFHTELESIGALHVIGDRALYFVRSDRQVPWRAIARELALLLAGTDVGTLAFAIHDVLAAETEAEAQAVLDEAGLPQLHAAPESRAGERDVRIAGEEAPTAEGDLPESPHQGAAGVREPSRSEDRPTLQEATLALHGERREASSAANGQSIGPEPVDSMEGEANGASVPARSAGHKGKGHPSRGTDSASPRPQRQLISYVSPGSTDGEGAGEVDERTSDIDRAGIELVLRFEEAAGRCPVEMPHANPGYDIESWDADGSTILRYIEVKSTADQWRERGVAMSRRQFDFATEKGEDSWLYVVERAGSSEARIHRIQNPARLANLFAYDFGWLPVAEC